MFCNWYGKTVYAILILGCLTIKTIVILYPFQLFEKLKIQESSENADLEKGNKTLVSAGSGESDRTEPELLESGKTKQMGTSEKETQRYGKIHTRHLSQLFIRGENVLLVNPQPLTGNWQLLKYNDCQK